MGSRAAAEEQASRSSTRPYTLSDELAMVLHVNLPVWLCLADRLAVAEVLGVCHQDTALHYPGSSLRDRQAISLWRSIRRGLCPRVTSVDVSRNALRAPACLSLCASLQMAAPSTRLQHLHLGGGGNDIEERGALALAQCIRTKALADLVTLSLQGASLGRAGVQELARAVREEGLLKLQDLDLSRGADLSAERRMQEVVQQDPRAVTEQQSSFRERFVFDEQAAEALACAMPSLPSLQRLALSGRWLGADGMAALAIAFEQGCCPALQRLELDRNALGDEGAGALAGALKHGLPSLTWLSLALNSITARGVAALSVVRVLRRVRQLDLRSNDVMDQGLAALFCEEEGAHLQSPLEVLDCHDNGIGHHGLHHLARAITDGRLPSLRQLYLSRNRLQSPDALASLARLEGLRALQLGDSGLLTPVSSVLPCLPACLEELDLSGMAWTVADVAALTPHAHRLATLRRLRLSRAAMGHVGVVGLADAMRAATATGQVWELRELGLAQCGIKPEAAIYLARAFLDGLCPRMRKLDLRHNLLSDAAAACVVKGLKTTCPSLREVDLRDNPQLSDKTDRGLAKYLAVHTKTKTPFHYLLGQGGADWGGQE